MLADFLSRADANKKVAICGIFYLPFGLICAIIPAMIEKSEAAKWIGEDHTGDQKGCTRCGAGEHLALVYKPFTHFIDFDDGFVATHWAPCPTNGEPILFCQRPKLVDAP